MIRSKRNRSLILFPAALVLLAAAGLSAASAPQEKPPAAMTLKDCIAQAVKRNLGVAVQVYSSELADIAVARSREKFLPSLSFEYGNQDQNSASYSWIDASDQVTTLYKNYSGSFDQLIPFGGSFSIALSGYRNQTNARFQTINPRYGSTLSFSFSQPLLKDFGWGISRRDILIARNNRDIGENDLKRTLLDTVYSVEQTYWQLVLSIESLKVRQQSLKLAEDLYEQSRKKVQIGTLAPKEILTVQSDVASRKADILQAASQVKDYTDALKAQINTLDPTAGGGEDIVPADLPPFQKVEIGVEEAFAAALRNRPDLQSTTLAVRNRELDYAYARNQLLPRLNLSANYWSPGIGGDQIIYLDNNPLTGVVIGTTPGGADMALRDAFGFKYKNWSVSVSLDVPLSSIVSRAAAAQAKASLDQETARLKNVEQQAYLEIRTAVRALQTNYERVDAYKAARELAEEKLAAEQAKLEAGLTTTFVVLSYQRDVANARLMELSALVDYTLSIARLEKAMGTSLDTKGIQLTDAVEE
jgi:outer membrane protein TolC